MVEIVDVFIYPEPRCAAIDFDRLAVFVRSGLPHVRVHLRGPLLESALDARCGRRDWQTLAEAFARAKVRDLNAAADPGWRPLPGEVSYELARLKNRASSVFGLLYDAGLILEIYRQLLPAAESGLDSVNIIFTNQLIGSLDEADKRYHTRSVILGAPAVVSTSGVVEAPARPAGYYIARSTAQVIGLSEIGNPELARSFTGDFLLEDDPRLTEVAAGLTLQALAYRMTGEPFCGSPECRLFNAHRQEELIRAQTGEAQFCRKHAELFAGC